MVAEKASVFTLTETRSEHAKSVIKEVCKLGGETFARDPNALDHFSEPIDIKVW